MFESRSAATHRKRGIVLCQVDDSWVELLLLIVCVADREGGEGRRQRENQRSRQPHRPTEEVL